MKLIYDIRIPVEKFSFSDRKNTKLINDYIFAKYGVKKFFKNIREMDNAKYFTTTITERSVLYGGMVLHVRVYERVREE